MSYGIEHKVAIFECCDQVTSDPEAVPSIVDQIPTILESKIFKSKITPSVQAEQTTFVFRIETGLQTLTDHRDILPCATHNYKTLMSFCSGLLMYIATCSIGFLIRVLRHHDHPIYMNYISCFNYAIQLA